MGRPSATGTFGRIVRFVLGLLLLAVLVAFGLLMLGVDPQAFGAVIDRLRGLV